MNMDNRIRPREDICSVTSHTTLLLFYLFLNHRIIFDMLTVIFSLLYYKAETIILVNQIRDLEMTVGLKTR